MAKDKLTHKEQIAQNRAKLAEIKSQREKETKRKKIALWSTLGIVIVAIAVIVAVVISTSNQNKVAVSDTSPNAAATDGIILTSQTNVLKGTGYNLDSGKPEDPKALLADSKVPHIQIYLDYDCPHCADFEKDSSEYLNSLLQRGAATIEYKPIVVIGSNLSISGANAAACVAEYAPERFNDAHNALFAQHGQQNVSVSKTIKNLNIAGDAGTKVNNCVSSKVFSKWVQKAGENALSLKGDDGKPLVAGTPTIIVDGVKYPYDPAQFNEFMRQIVDGGKTAAELVKQG